MRLSPTSKKILGVFFDNPENKFYINELIRQTGLYPNSIYQSLKTLEKQKMLIPSRVGRLKYYTLNDSYKYLSEVEKIIGGKQKKKPSTKGSEFNWVKILNRQGAYSFSIALCEANMKGLKEIYGVSVSTYWYNFVTFGVYYSKNELVGLGQVMAEKIESDKNFARKDIAMCRKTCDELVSLAKKIPLLDLPTLTDKELVSRLRKFYRRYVAVFPFMTVPHGVERCFETKIRDEVRDEEVLKILLSPASMDDEERDSALEIAAVAKERGFTIQFNKLLKSHWERFCWLSLFSLQDQPLSIEYFETEIRNILDKVKNPKKELRRIKEEGELGKKRLKDVLKKIEASRVLKETVELLQEYIHLRIYRKNAICQAHYYHLPLMHEVGRRLGLNEKEVKLLSHKEMIDGLSKTITKKQIQLSVVGREKDWAVLMWKGKVKTITSVKEIIETMERFRIIAPTSAMQRTVKGSVACRGKATGRVKIIRKLSELPKVEQGDILVTKMTTPDYVMAMHKAAAIVTDEGGITCHAAIVSREFNIPCITGTRNATQILADNDLVEVDAMEGVVRVVEAVEAPEDVKTISGKTIYEGKVRGPARIVLDASDFVKVESGDILIAPQTTPEYLSSLYKVKGFVVDEESLTSHAVLYGTALKLPSIMGTGFARNAIQDGEEIELNATNGLIKRITDINQI